MVSIRSLQGLFDNFKSEGYHILLGIQIVTTYYSPTFPIRVLLRSPPENYCDPENESLILSESAYDLFKTGNCNREECETLSVYTYLTN